MLLGRYKNEKRWLKVSEWILIKVIVKKEDF